MKLEHLLLTYAIIIIIVLITVIARMGGLSVSEPCKLISIIELQEYLNERGHSIVEDGKCGPLTEAAWNLEYEKQDYSALFKRAENRK